MSRAVAKAADFKQDFALRFAWYVDEAGPEVARRFQSALDQTLSKLANRPDLGRPRNFRNPRLQGLRSLPVERPFNRLLIFYHADSDALHSVRLIHGARDLPRRLVETPLTEQSAQQTRPPRFVPAFSRPQTARGFFQPVRLESTSPHWP